MKSFLLFALLLTAAFSVAPSAKAAPSAGPKMSNGYSVDWCLHWGTECGKPAADYYCKLSGYPGGSTSFTTAYMYPTWVMGDNKICNGNYCGGFTSIQCATGGTQATTGPKMSNGYSVDWCLHWGSECGKPAADYYCKQSGYPGGASNFTTAAMHPTWVMGENKICNENGCNGFTSIQCATGGTQAATGPKMSNGYSVDWCLHWGSECGKPAADYYCKLSGYPAGASNFTTAAMHPTWVMGENKVCNENGCNGFTSIQCAGGTPPPPPPPQQTTGIAGRWTFASGCDPAHFGPTNTTAAEQLVIAEASDGSLTGGFGAAKPEILGPQKAAGYGNDRSVQNGNNVSIVLYPQGWVSVIYYRGTLSGSTITGTAQHYEEKCSFTMTYQGR